LQEIFDSHLALTRALLEREGPVDVVVWPESAIQGNDAGGAIDAVQDLARSSDTPFLVGRSFVEDGERYLNLQLYIDARGRLRDSYSKRHPVPFGEYVPVGFLRRFVGTLESEIPVDQEPGTLATVFNVEDNTIATPICFESVFPRDFLDFAREGAELYVLSTNNASFEHSYASQQHIAHTRMRALETRQWIAQAALAGISAQIAPDGTISHATDLFTAETFVTDLRVREASSLYARTGDLFPALFALTAPFAALVALRRRSITGATSEETR
jgi:apolipoprotein N-acyltransferase